MWAWGPGCSLWLHRQSVLAPSQVPRPHVAPGLVWGLHCAVLVCSWLATLPVAPPARLRGGSLPTAVCAACGLVVCPAVLAGVCVPRQHLQPRCLHPLATPTPRAGTWPPLEPEARACVEEVGGVFRFQIWVLVGVTDKKLGICWPVLATGGAWHREFPICGARG